MKKYYAFLVLLFGAHFAFGQQTVNLFPNTGPKYPYNSGYVETATTIFIPARLFGTKSRASGSSTIRASALLLYKYNKATATFTDSLVIAGDTAQVDSIYGGRPVSCYHNGQLYFLSNRYFFYPNGTNDEALHLTVVDTNLNVILTNKKLTGPQMPTSFKGLTSMAYHQGRLLASYYHIVYGSPNRLISRGISLRTDGTLVVDSLLRSIPDTVVKRLATLVVKEIENDTVLYIGGNGLGNCRTCLYKTDTLLRVKQDYGELNPPSGSSGEDFKALETSFSDIVGGTLFTAGEYVPTFNPCGSSVTNIQFTFVSKHKKADGFRASKSISIENSSCTNNSKNYQIFKKVLYSKTDNVVYYVNFNHGNVNNNYCDTIQNEIQIVCVDTNLNLKWRKLIAPKAGTCAQTTQAFLPEKGSGLTIVGNYFDNAMPQNLDLAGIFMLQVDSAGLLSTGNTPNFTIRDRFTVYPNPATSTLWVEDIAGIPAKAFLYDLVGRQMAAYTLTGRKNRLELPVGIPGMYLLRIVPQYGEGWSQMVQVRE